MAVGFLAWCWGYPFYVTGVEPGFMGRKLREQRLSLIHASGASDQISLSILYRAFLAKSPPSSLKSQTWNCKILGQNERF